MPWNDNANPGPWGSPPSNDDETERRENRGPRRSSGGPRGPRRPEGPDLSAQFERLNERFRRWFGGPGGQGVRPGAVAAVAGAAEPGLAAARGSYDGRPGHPVLLGRALLARAGELRGDVGFRDLLSGEDVREIEVGGLADPVDIDTQEELARL